ncbi:MAG TPA: hypothetical protein VG871_12175 [Vicinamibacterales bacterium]|nr:hypothetical protein [Vicinamibacterales bacterium]
MEANRWTRLAAALLLLLCSTRGARAQAPPQAVEHVRTDSPPLRRAIASGVERSPTFRRIVDRLEQSDVIVEVQCARFAESTLAGRTVLLSAQPGVRYVLVEIACSLTSPTSLYMIGHELRHALEIADAPWVVDGPTLAELYRDIGFPTCGLNTKTFGKFETAAALDAGERVHHELFHPGDPARRVAAGATTVLTEVVTNTK